MASVTKSDIPEISAFMTDFWVLVKKYWIPEPPDDSAYWDSVVGELGALYRKYKYHGFVVCVGNAFLDYLDAACRNR